MLRILNNMMESDPDLYIRKYQLSTSQFTIIKPEYKLISYLIF